MKKYWISFIVMVILAFISSCNGSNPAGSGVTPKETFTAVNTITATPALTPAPACSPVTLSFAAVATTTCSVCPANKGIIINSQADYDANYTGPALAPIDFAKNTLIGFPANLTCGISWTLTGVTSDCDTVYLNFTKTYCVWCNVVLNNELYYLIDKTNLPIDVIITSVVCNGTPAIGTPAPLVN
jgi:hypothetical protein